MRRGIGIGFVAAALMAALSMTSVAAAPRHPFSVKVARNAIPGGQLSVVVAESPLRGRLSVKYRAAAVIHFASGDVSAHLVSRGSSLVASVRVPVGQHEQPGDVPVDVTVTARNHSFDLHGLGHIRSVKTPR